MYYLLGFLGSRCDGNVGTRVLAIYVENEAIRNLICNTRKSTQARQTNLASFSRFLRPQNPFTKAATSYPGHHQQPLPPRSLLFDAACFNPSSNPAIDKNTTIDISFAHLQQLLHINPVLVEDLGKHFTDILAFYPVVERATLPLLL